MHIRPEQILASELASFDFDSKEENMPSIMRAAYNPALHLNKIFAKLKNAFNLPKMRKIHCKMEYNGCLY